jgi:hypothetical protein
MSETIPDGCDCPDSLPALRERIHRQTNHIIAYCESCEDPFFRFEKELFALVRVLGCLFVCLFLLSRHQRLSLKAWLADYRVVNCWVPRQLKTAYGIIRYGRAYLARRRGSRGFHPLDAALGLTRDIFSPWVISLATRLTTRLSFQTAKMVVTGFWGWSPSTEALEDLVLGLARSAPTYMASRPPFPEADGDILVIEVDGKAAPMARPTELEQRRGPRRHGLRCTCGCQRHRGRARRRQRGPKKRRKKWAKDKNGRSATLVVMYTLQRGDDGLLHGPINKRVWGSFAQRKVMLQWSRAEASRRGFPADTTKQILILMDGEKCLALTLKQLFPQAVLTLDIRHVEEKLWLVGQAFHPESSRELAAWVEELRTLLYTQGGATLLGALRQRLAVVPVHGPGTRNKRRGLIQLIGYVEGRLEMMEYPKRLAQDMPVATGVVEGAVRHVIGQRLDCGGMRWVVGKAEAMLRLRCLEVNGLWDDFFEWNQQQWCDRLQRGEPLLIRTEEAIPLPEAA